MCEQVVNVMNRWLMWDPWRYVAYRSDHSDTRGSLPHHGPLVYDCCCKKFCANVLARAGFRLITPTDYLVPSRPQITEGSVERRVIVLYLHNCDPC
jgi:hypothetical protein